MNQELEKYYQEEERQEALEHRDVLLAIGSIIKTRPGQTLFKYLFKNLQIAELPDRTLDGNMLHDHLGFLRAGNSIYKLACEADAFEAAQLLSKIEREKYDKLIERTRVEQQQSNNSD